ncbi:hypothetical protein [Variovorax sp. JS1663]|uniref:hypothetical protein n=1 Tax=Variovorax sp. JS1663 TaxID=1851577 RepID=UPI000B6DE963|nr:hypothetical protein [Variovorax sp. JS1663]OUM02003.1 hypothetical protein A8M77_12890 [Variovorax sp. JS1663]
MLRFFRPKGAAGKGETRPDLPDVSQPVPLTHHEDVEDGSGLTVVELSEMEARAMCAREDIPIFWRRPGEHKRKA